MAHISVYVTWVIYTNDITVLLNTLYHTDSNKIRTISHGARVLSDQSLLNMMSFTSVKKRRKNYYFVYVEEAITEIQTGNISQAKPVRKYGIPC